VATGERFHEAEIHRLRGEVILERDPCRSEEAARHLRRAMGVAGAQGAAPFRQRAEAALARLPAAGQRVS
jgi:hypothetical protein